MGYVRIKPRLKAIQQDERRVKQFREYFKNNLQDKEVWFCDESGFAADMAPRKRWAVKGSRPVHYYRGDHLRTNLIGAVAPKSGELESLIISGSDTDVFQYFLDYLKERTKNRPISLVMDNASWHHANALKRGNIYPVYLPPYSPELNPIEELWKVIKDRFCYAIPPDDIEELQDRLQRILQKLFANKNEVKSICKIAY